MMTPDDLDVYGHFRLGLLPTMDSRMARTRHKAWLGPPLRSIVVGSRRC